MSHFIIPKRVNEKYATLQQDHYPIIHDWSFTDSTIGFTWYQEKINPSSLYGVYWKVWNDNAWNRDTIPSGQLTHTLTGLNSAEVYYIKIIPVINGIDKLHPSWIFDLSYLKGAPLGMLKFCI